MENTEKPTGQKIIRALIAARKVITEPRALRNADTGKFKYSFADLDEVLDCVVGPCLEQGIVISQTPVYEAGHAGVKTTLMHDSGEVLNFPALLLPAPRLEPQGAGICISYARRYALLSIFNLAQVDEDGAYNRYTGPADQAATVNEPPKSTAQTPKATAATPAATTSAPAADNDELAPAAWIKRLDGVVANSGIAKDEILAHFGIEKFDGLTKADIVAINTWVAEKAQVAA